MPFQSTPPSRPPQGANPNDYPLQRLGGLYPSKSGNALTGNLPDGSLLALEQVIADARASGRPLRFIIFENTRGGANAPPYSMQVTLGTPRQPGPQGGGWQSYQPQPQQPYAPPDPDGGEAPGDPDEGEEQVPEWVQAPQPPPQPRTRRTPPPRG